MKFRKFLIFISVILLIFTGYFSYVKLFFVNSIKDFDKKVEMQLKDKKEVNFSEIVKEDFDEILIVYPYLSKENILEKTGINLNTTRRYRDGIFIKNTTPILSEGLFGLVFLKDKKIVTLGEVKGSLDLKILEKFENDGIFIIPKDFKIKIIK